MVTGADAALEWIMTLREALYAVFFAEARGRAPDREVAALVGAAARKALGLRILSRERDGFAWKWGMVAWRDAYLAGRRANRTEPPPMP